MDDKFEFFTFNQKLEETVFMFAKEENSENTTNSSLWEPRTTEIDMSQSAC